MKDGKHENIWFLGIGGIGMSALAHYFMLEGRRVGGYDRTETAITRRLAEDGAAIHYDDDPALIPPQFRKPADTMVVYTPALPADHAELNWFRSNGFEVLKRSEILGVVAEGKYVMAVAGTHGKTTTTTLLAWINHVAGGGGSAFLGGISKNFDSNFVSGGAGIPGCADMPDGRGGSISCIDGRGGLMSGIGGCEKLAVEADEFDRSFLRLHPDVAVITSADADHLDIYGTHEELKEAFAQFAGQIKPGGTLILNEKADIKVDNPLIRVYTYSLDGDTDFHAANISHTGGGKYSFDLVFPHRPGMDKSDGQHRSTGLNSPDDYTNPAREAEYLPYTVKNCTLGIPGLINIENAVAAAAMAWAAAHKAAAGSASAGMAKTGAAAHKAVAGSASAGTAGTTARGHTATGAAANDTEQQAIPEVWPAGWNEEKLREALVSFKGVRRRFDFHINTRELVYMDDYAHHPEELRAVIGSMKDMFPQRRLTVVFQPHLYTRTRDFYREFADALSLADEVVLVPVYPAREEPIEGVSSQMIGEQLAASAEAKKATPYRIIPKEMLAQELAKMPLEVLLTAGAGDIENYCGEIAERLKIENRRCEREQSRTCSSYAEPRGGKRAK